MDAAAARAEYADARFVHTRSERLSTRNGAVDQVDSNDTEGIGVRVRVGGSWGFAAARGTDRRTPRRRSSGRWRSPPPSPPRAAPRSPLSRPRPGTYASPAERDPFDVPLEDKLALLRAPTPACAPSREVTLTLARFQAVRVHKLFASTEGALCEQVLTECGGGLSAVAVSGDETQVRSFPTLARRSHGAGRLRALPGARPRGPGAARVRRGGGAAERAGLPVRSARR